MSIWAVVLAGGVGSRFWPVSTAARPKQLLPLVTDEPLLRDALSRMRDIAPSERTLILSNATLADAVADVAPEIPRGNIIAEPLAAGTAGALAWAALEIRRRGGEGDVMACVHADWAIGRPEAFVRTVRQAAQAAADTGMLLTVGIVPTRPDPGFGYLVPGEAHASGARRVATFLEKPTRERAAELMAEGALWNSGIFVWRVGLFLDELRRHTPEIAAAMDAGTLNDFFSAVRPISVDVGLMERSSKVLVIPGDFGWDDVGTWAALLRARAADGGGNVKHGPAHLRDSRNSVAYSSGPTVVLYGVENLVVVATGDTTLVTTVDRAADLKQLVEGLPPELRDRT